MHPGFIGWWKHARGPSHGGFSHGSCGDAVFEGREGCGGGGQREGGQRDGGQRDGGPGEGRGHHGHGHHGHDHHGHGHHGHEGHFAAGIDADEMGAFGVRRPLRFLANKLELDDAQVDQLAAILSDLKTERAQVAVDQRRRIASLAEALEGPTLDATKLSAAGDEQVKSAERLRVAVAKALEGIHALLGPEQRKRLAYLLRTGVLSI